MNKWLKNNFKKIMAFSLSAMIFGQVALANGVGADETDVLGEVKLRLIQYYKGGIPVEVLGAETVEEVIKIVDDKYTTYMSAEEAQEYQNGLDNAFFGIGVGIAQVEEGIKVEKVFGGSPSEKVGLMVEDIIIEADGHELKGLSLDAARNHIIGEQGTKVKLKVKRGEEILQFEPERDKINLGTIDMEWLNEGTTAHIIIDRFGEDTHIEFYNMIKECENSGAENYIIDLRGNLGGYMSSALNIASTIIGDNTVIVADSNFEENEQLKGEKTSLKIDKPIIFLVNEYSASSSEILSAAVKDYDKAYFIGNQTYGKGIAQSIIPLSNGGKLKVTSKEFFPPSRRKVHKVGVTPNLEVEKVNPLVLAMMIFDQEDGSNLYKETKKKPLTVSDDDEFTDDKLNGWKMNVDMLQKEIIIKPEDNINIEFNRDVYEDIGAIKDSIELVEGRYGKKVEFDVEVEGAKIIIDPKVELDEEVNYILQFEPDLKAENGFRLNRGKFAIIEVEK